MCVELVSGMRGPRFKLDTVSRLPAGAFDLKKPSCPRIREQAFAMIAMTGSRTGPDNFSCLYRAITIGNSFQPD
jgi:hypothetical protein